MTNNNVGFTVRVTDRNAVVLIDEIATVVGSTDPRYENVLAAAKARDLGALRLALNPPPKERILSQIGAFKVTDAGVYWDGRLLDGSVVNRIMEFVAAGQPIEPMLRFLVNLYENPSNTSREQLYNWLQHKEIPITDEGTILCYKAVQADLYSVHGGSQIPLQGERNSSGQIFNGIGETIEFRRHDVDDNTRNHCSNGLHVGSLKYVRDFKPHNGVIVIVELNPADVVSVPEDCDCQKVRCTKYKVLGAYDGPLPDVLPRETKATYAMSDDDVDMDDLETDWEEDEVEDCDYDNGYDAGFEEGRAAALKEVAAMLARNSK